MKKKMMMVSVVGLLVLGALAVSATPANAIVAYCVDPDDGPMVCYYDLTPEEYCLLHLPTTVSPALNPETKWDEKNNRCYFYHDNIGCAPNWNMLADFYKIYTIDGTFMDDYGRYVWVNGVSSCAILKGNNEFKLSAKFVVRDGGNGITEFYDGNFSYDYATCNGLCRVNSNTMTPQATRALDLLPYKMYEKGFITILNAAGELAEGTFRLCYNHNYKENKNLAFFRYNGTDWSYYGGFWNLKQTKFCMYSSVSGNYVLADLGQ